MTFIDYSKDFWCSFCGRKVKVGQENYDKNGMPRCPGLPGNKVYPGKNAGIIYVSE